MEDHNEMRIAQVNLAGTLSQLGMYQKAIRHYEAVHTAVEDKSDQTKVSASDKKFKAELFFEMGYCYSKLKRFAKAREIYAEIEGLFMLLDSISEDAKLRF